MEAVKEKPNTSAWEKTPKHWVQLELLPRCSGPHSPPSSHSKVTWCSSVIDIIRGGKTQSRNSRKQQEEELSALKMQCFHPCWDHTCGLSGIFSPFRSFASNNGCGSNPFQQLRFWASPSLSVTSCTSFHTHVLHSVQSIWDMLPCWRTVPAFPPLG